MCFVCRVLCELQCEAVLAMPAKKKNSKGRTTEEPIIKEGGVDVEICLGSRVQWCESEGRVLVY